MIPGAGLHDEVSEGGRLHGTGDDFAAGGVGGELAEEFVLGAAADDMDGAVGAAEGLLELFEDLTIAQGEAFECAANGLACVFGRWAVRIVGRDQ